jgi:hypothetical protein
MTINKLNINMANKLLILLFFDSTLWSILIKQTAPPPDSRPERRVCIVGTFPRNKLADVNRMVMNFAVNPVIQPHIRSGLITPPFTPYYGDLCNIIRTYENWPQAGSSTDGDPVAASGSADSGGSGSGPSQ